jgi:heme-degrading monooxygenase HmoA
MIARIWRGHTRAADADEYTQFVERTGLTDYRATPGNLGAAILRKVGGGTAEFLVLSLWEDFDAIRRFAGPDAEKAHYYPEDDRFLLGKEPNVAHYEVAARVGPLAVAGAEHASSVRFAADEE